MSKKIYGEKDYLRIFTEHGYVYIEDTYTNTNVALNDGDFDIVIASLNAAREDGAWRKRARKDASHIVDGKVVF